MRWQEKFGKVHFVLLALTLAFLGMLAALAMGDRGATVSDAYRIETERAVPAETGGEAADALLDVNAATVEELQELTGIGPVLAQAIVDYRAEHGPFRSVDELLAVSGIGETRLNEIRDEITVNGG